MAVAAESWFSTVGDASPGGVVFDFVRTEGIPAPVLREYREVRRKGVDHLGHYLGGLIGEQFDLKTFVDVADVAAAKVVQLAYRAAEGSELDLWWQHYKVGKVFVYAAAPQPVQQIEVGVGGFNDGGAIAETIWKLRGVG